MKQEIPVPIMFSPVKHHLYFLQEEIQRWKNESWEQVSEELLPIGLNLIDFYIGSLTVDQICDEILGYFRQNKLLERKAFENWLQALNWKKLRLSDDSEWLIKPGKNEERYIHVHPAKQSKHSIRVRATTLKTVLALQVQELNPEKVAKSDLENVNSVRKNLLDLSPIKSLHSSNSGIMRLWLLFNETSREL